MNKNNESNHDENKIVEEVKKQLLNDNIFKKALLLDLLSWIIKTIGVGGTIFVILIGLFGFQSLGSMAENTMRNFMESKGSEFERQFNRLSKIPSYVTVSSELIVNNPDSNFITLPIFPDINRPATIEECEWFFTPN